MFWRHKKIYLHCKHFDRESFVELQFCRFESFFIIYIFASEIILVHNRREGIRFYHINGLLCYNFLWICECDLLIFSIFIRLLDLHAINSFGRANLLNRLEMLVLAFLLNISQIVSRSKRGSNLNIDYCTFLSTCCQYIEVTYWGSTGAPDAKH